LSAGQSLNNAFCQGSCGEHSYLRSATAIHSVALDQTPNLPMGGGHSTTKLIATPDIRPLS